MSPMRLLVVTPLLGAVLLCAGCQNQPSHFANPLYSADRVPPPATRSLAPGSAQPYYSGDPLPIMPGGSPAPGQSSSASPTESLDWSSPTTARVEAPPRAVATSPQTPSTTAPPPAANAAGWWDAPLKSAAPAQEVLPVSWSELPPTSTPPRVRIPLSHVAPATVQPLETTPVGGAAPAGDGFRPRGARSAPY